MVPMPSPPPPPPIRPTQPLYRASKSLPPARLPNATIACNQCRKDKAKCIGGAPCARCRKENKQCIVDENRDGRRKVALKHKLETLEQDRSLLIQLLETLRGEDQVKADRLLRVIRKSKVSFDEIRRCIDNDFDPDAVITDESRLTRADSQQHLSRSRSSSRLRVMDVKWLSDNPRWKVPAQPWTSVSDDDDFVSHLVSLFFTWHNNTLNWIDPELFFMDMEKGQLGAQFCSPLLVNSILAVACFYSSYPEVFAEPSDPNTRGMHFYNEAKRLLDEQQGKYSVTNLQGLGGIYTWVCITGKDRFGYLILGQMAEQAQHMMKFRDSIIAKAGDQAENTTRAIDVTTSGVYNFLPTACLALQRALPFKKPPPRHLPETHDPKDTWMPYPVQAEPVQAHTNCLVNALSKLGCVTWDLCSFFFSNNDKLPQSDTEKMAVDIYTDLQQWTEEIPECVSLRNVPTPGVLDMHLRYHSNIMTIFGFIQNPSTIDKSSPAHRARELRLSSAHELRKLLDIQHTKWPIECMTMSSSQFSTVALFTLLEDLDNPSSASAFADTAISLFSTAKRLQLAKGMFRLVQGTALQKKIRLSPEIRNIFRDFDEVVWAKEDKEKFSSLYPNFAVTVQYESVGEAELDDFLEQWDTLALGDHGTPTPDRE